jgi:hypothetical protein
MIRKTLLFLSLTASTAFAQTTAPATAPSNFEAHEWVVLICSPYQTMANQDGVVLSTLPAEAESRRQSAPDDQANEPQPIGVIRLIGSAGSPVDVSLGIPKGKVMASWPKGRTKTNQLLWHDLKLSADLPPASSMEGASVPEPLDAASWFNALRNDSSAWLRTDRALERFLAYDLELDYSSPLRIAGGTDFKYQLTDTFPEGMLDLNLYKPDGNSWRHGEMPALGGASVFAPATQPTTSTALVLAATQPVRAAELTLGPSPSTQPADLLSPWKAKLAGQGLAPSDVDLILRILEKHALDPKRLTAVYELDSAEMDRLMPLEILPEPTKTVRVGIVILKDADPGVASEIDDLVAQLGDDDWSKRDAAYQSLAKLGKAAKTQLEKAQRGKDMEVVWRAERLLAAMNAPQPTPDQ